MRCYTSEYGSATVTYPTILKEAKPPIDRSKRSIRTKPAVGGKINIEATTKKDMLNGWASAVQKSTLPQKDSAIIADVQHTNDNLSSRPTERNGIILSGRTASRYTISSTSLSLPNTSFEGARHDPVARLKPELESTLPSEPISKGVDDSIKPSCAALPTDLLIHQGQTANIRPPFVGDDLQSRLTGLKQFKAWSERIHEDLVKHKKILAQVKKQNRVLDAVALSAVASVEVQRPPLDSQTSPLLAPKDLHVQPESGIVETNTTVPTPFSTPQITPVLTAWASTGSHKIRASHSSSPPDLDLQSNHDAGLDRTRALSRTITISSTPAKELEKQALSRSNASYASTSRSRSRTREKRYPPVSFPKGFNDRFIDAEPKVALHRDQTVTDPRNTTPSTSPMTALVDKGQSNVDKPGTQATPHDSRGRPAFYSTVHFYTECPHASPPATRPLDPAAQPRVDPEFHHTNPAVTRSIIPGMCFNCDTLYRRRKENDIVKVYMSQIAELTHKLANLVGQLESIEPEYDNEDDTLNDRHSARLHTTCTFDEDAHDLQHQLSSSTLPPLSDDPSIPNVRIDRAGTTEEQSHKARVLTQIHSIEAVIDEVRDEQDTSVRKVWKGYTPRWGPATLGVQRGTWSENVERYQTKEDHHALLDHQGRSIAQRLAMPDEISAFDDSEDDRDVRVKGRIDSEDSGINATSKDGVCAPCQQQSRRYSGGRDSSRSLSRGRSGTINSSTGVSSATASTTSKRDLPGSRAPGEGKMRVGWIRE